MASKLTARKVETAKPGKYSDGGNLYLIVSKSGVRLEALLDESAINLRDRRAAWQKAGWKSFDAGSKPNGAEEVRKERALYGGGLR
jgi:hypothetical protein